MNFTADKNVFLGQLLRFKPVENASQRTLALYSAAVALADDTAMERVLGMGDRYSVTRDTFYEIVLQSYLFLGFPRMLGAAECLHRFFHDTTNGSRLGPISPDESDEWYSDGLKLCREVYAGKYEPLKKKVEGMAPEVFRWMIIEGYGKVLSRPQVDISTRELSIIAFLMMENRQKQLRAHIKGALNVGTPRQLIEQTVSDIGPAAGDGMKTALAVINQAG
ncbi:MAG: carboxymuconolactone decarboxylase family protein [candidate division Zixibacteria bacterium]|nr:carboxymuconolactone decarboxylase family protein [candidate division Zixibacteria bacterium]